MKTVAAAALALAALSVAGCRAETGNTGATISIDGNAADRVENFAADAGNVIENGVNDAGNLASKAGDEIQNQASSAGNRLERLGNDIGDGPDNRNANKTGR